MSKRKAGRGSPVSVEEVIDGLVQAAGDVTSGQVAEAAGVTRQAAHYHLRRLVEAGRLRREGAGRGARYVLAVDFHATYALEGLREDDVWSEVRARVPSVGGARPNVDRILRFAFTEMVNNAVDHSGGTGLQVDVAAEPTFFFRVADDGVGVFRHFASRVGLEDEAAAAFELTKGKRSSDPDRHSGQGIFFTSRLVDRLGLEANGIRLTVDDHLNDFAVGTSRIRVGTTVWWEVEPHTGRDPEAVFGAFTDDETLEFTRTRIPLRVLGGPSFISRAEAKRVADRLERFDEAVVDFEGVTDVGHAFVDELFRVWASQHPETRLVPVGASPIVERLIRSIVRHPSASG